MTEDAPITKTLIVKKRGRKYFDCIIGGYKAKLLINAVSNDLAIERVVNMEVKDLSERGKYGTSLKFEPIKIISDRDAKALYDAAIKRNEEERERAKWMDFAEQDIRKGWYRSNAIHKALDLCSGQEGYADRHGALVEAVERNRQAEALEKKAEAEAKASRAAERAAVPAPASAGGSVPYPLSNAPPLNTVMRDDDGDIVVFTGYGRKFRITEDDPSVYGYEFLGYEGEMAAYYDCRPATAEETAEFEAKEAKAKTAREARKHRKNRLAAIAKHIRENGERPESFCYIKGEYLASTFTLYGGGSAFLVDAEYLWYLIGNGADGDDWSQNNVSNGNIGYRLPLDAALVAELRELDTEMTKAEKAAFAD